MQADSVFAGLPTLISFLSVKIAKTKTFQGKVVAALPAMLPSDIIFLPSLAVRLFVEASLLGGD